MALGFNVVKGLHGEDRFSVGNLDMKFVDVTLDTDYVDQGWPVTDLQLGFYKVLGVNVMGLAQSADKETAAGVSYDHVNKKLIANVAAAAAAPFAEAADGLDGLTGMVVRLQVWGFAR